MSQKLFEELEKKIGKNDPQLNSLSRLVSSLILINQNLLEKNHNLTNSFRNMEEYVQKLDSETSVKNQELLKAKEYVGKLLTEIENKEHHASELEKFLRDYSKRVSSIEESKKKYYSSRL